MNKRQKKKLWTQIQKREESWVKAGIIFLGGGIQLPYGWIYNKHKQPIKLI